MVFQSPPCSCREVTVSVSLCQGQGLSCTWHLVSAALKEVRCFWAFSRATLAPSSSVACEGVCQTDPLVSKVLAMVMVQAAFLQSLGHCTRMYLPLLDFGCWPGSLGQGLSVGEEATGCSVYPGDLQVQGWGLLGTQAGHFLSNSASASRVRDRAVFLSPNEVRLGKKKRRTDMQWIQGIQSSWGEQKRLAGVTVCLISCFTLEAGERMGEATMSPLPGQKS